MHISIRLYAREYNYIENTDRSDILYQILTVVVIKLIWKFKMFKISHKRKYKYC